MSASIFKKRCRSFCRCIWVTTRRPFRTNELPRTDVHLNSKVNDELETRLYRPKKHPGRISDKTIRLPMRYSDAVDVLLKESSVKSLASDAKDLSQYLLSRKPPLEKEDLFEKSREIEQKILQEGNFTEQNDEVKFQKSLKNKVLARLRQTTYNWEPVNYNFYKGILYLVGRSPANYAALTRILTELHQRAPEFNPSAILDFGSGTGTALWSAYGLWGDNIKEYFAVDVSGDMNSIAQRLLQDGEEHKRTFIKGVFFRQFLPALHTLQYDLVTSSYSLMELPSRIVRLQTLANLWAKTADVLVIIENGTKAGYNLVQEARDFILKTSPVDAHVFSPCSHDAPCPKLDSKIPCNFEVAYMPLMTKEKVTERYSYVVLRKRKRPTGEAWPRIISPVLPRGGHAICRLCCSDGQLKEVVVTQSKHAKTLYKCARASRWGDLLPVSNHDKSVESDTKTESNS